MTFVTAEVLEDASYIGDGILEKNNKISTFYRFDDLGEATSLEVDEWQMTEEISSTALNII